MIRASVIIAAYKAVNDLERAVGSVLAQTEPNLEIVIVDDRSPDRTFELALALSARDPRVRAFQVEANVGPGFARNLGLQVAQGEWVAVLDADDAFHPKRLEQLIALGQKGKADVVSDNLALRDPTTGTVTGLMFPPDWFATEPQLLEPAAFVIGNMGNAQRVRMAYGFVKPLIRRAFLQERKLQYRISRFAEDYILYLELLAHGARWLMTAESYYDYDVRPGSLSIKVSTQEGQAVAAAERELLSLPAVRANAELITAMHHHLRSMELSTAWVRFADALKARNLPGALAAATTDSGTVVHVLREGAIHLRRALTRRRA